MKIIFRYSIVLVLLGTLVLSCSSAPVYLSNEYGTPVIHEERKPREQTANGCIVNISKIEDLRVNRESLGNVAGRVVYHKGVTEWLASGFNTLGDYGYQVLFNNEMDPVSSPIVNIAVKLKILTIRSISTSKSASIVLAAEYSTGAGLESEKMYRSSHTNINWASTDDEIHTIFNIILSEVIGKVSKDAVNYCH